jgi:hypothetical protein
MLFLNQGVKGFNSFQTVFETKGEKNIEKKPVLYLRKTLLITKPF